jgi:integrase
VTGRRDGSGGLSPRTVGHMHRVIKQALGQAVRWKELTHNPADAVDPPKVDWKPMQTYDLPQTVEVIEAVRDTPMLIPTVLAVLCGLRRGEICALRWRNVDLELRAHRIKRDQELLRLGVGLSDDDLVIAQADGSMVQPIYISQLWARTIRTTKLVHLRFHDLRHAHATHLLANGVHLKVASERLGHSKVGITLDLYSHVIPGMQEDAAALVDRALNRNGSKAVANRFGGTNAESKKQVISIRWDGGHDQN